MHRLLASVLVLGALTACGGEQPQVAKAPSVERTAASTEYVPFSVSTQGSPLMAGSAKVYWARAGVKSLNVQVDDPGVVEWKVDRLDAPVLADGSPASVPGDSFLAIELGGVHIEEGSSFPVDIQGVSGKVLAARYEVLPNDHARIVVGLRDSASTYRVVRIPEAHQVALEVQ